MTPEDEKRIRAYARDSVNLQLLFAEIDDLREEIGNLKAKLKIANTQRVPCDRGSREHCDWTVTGS